MTFEARNILFSEIVTIFFSLSMIDQDVENFVSAHLFQFNVSSSSSNSSSSSSSSLFFNFFAKFKSMEPRIFFAKRKLSLNRFY